MDRNRELVKAVSLHNRGKLNAAQKIYRKLLAAHSRHAGALSGLGMIAFQRGNHTRAAHLLEQALKVEPANPLFYMNLGVVLEADGRLEGAERAYTRAIALELTFADPYYNLGNLYLQLGEPSRAVNVFDQCMQARGRDFHALAYKAHALREAGRDDESAALLDIDSYLRTYKVDEHLQVDSADLLFDRLAEEVAEHPTIQKNIMSSVNAWHTGELFDAPSTDLGFLRDVFNAAVNWYASMLPVDAMHPMVRWRPDRWRMTGWGVVMRRGGYEKAHIHPNGWVSGVIYLEVPEFVSHSENTDHQGWLELGRPTGELKVARSPELSYVQPIRGQVVLFPSYFFHSTVPLRRDERRICIAFDAEPLN